ncbi:MAG: hypothetical protein H6Q57_1689 [Geobacteraceae bacterium]|nr:hypothetical protein [Geobacteraceae bacterium]
MLRGSLKFRRFDEIVVEQGEMYGLFQGGMFSAKVVEGENKIQATARQIFSPACLLLEQFKYARQFIYRWCVVLSRQNKYTFKIKIFVRISWLR